jgi:hypothetical protein
MGEAREYEDEEGNLNLPDQIRGRDVIGTADEFVIGGDLVLHSDSYP